MNHLQSNEGVLTDSECGELTMTGWTKRGHHSRPGFSKLTQPKLERVRAGGTASGFKFPKLVEY